MDKKVKKTSYTLAYPLGYKGKIYKAGDKIRLTSEQKKDLIKYLK